jgi:hypothetical protein
MMTVQEKVHFIAVNYRSSDAVATFVGSLLRQDCDAWTLTLVDNSEDQQEARRLDRMAAASDHIEVRVAPSNLGYFGAVHWIASEMRHERPLWTIVSNVDLQLAESTFVRRLLQENSAAAVLAPSVLSMPGGAEQNPFLETRPRPRWMHRRKLIFANPLSGQLYGLASWARSRLASAVSGGPGPSGGRRDIYAPHGSFVALHRRFFDAGATLEHPVFLFNEEITVGEQCRLLRLPVVFEPSLRVVHEAHRSTGVLRSRRVLRAQSEAAAYGYRLIAGLTLPPALTLGSSAEDGSTAAAS